MIVLTFTTLFLWPKFPYRDSFQSERKIREMKGSSVILWMSIYYVNIWVKPWIVWVTNCVRRLEKTSWLFNFPCITICTGKEKRLNAFSFEMSHTTLCTLSKKQGFQFEPLLEENKKKNLVSHWTSLLPSCFQTCTNWVRICCALTWQFRYTWNLKWKILSIQYNFFRVKVNLFWQARKKMIEQKLIHGFLQFSCTQISLSCVCFGLLLYLFAFVFFFFRLLSLYSRYVLQQLSFLWDSLKYQLTGSSVLKK